MKTEKRYQVDGKYDITAVTFTENSDVLFMFDTKSYFKVWQPPKVQRSILWPTWLIKESY